MSKVEYTNIVDLTIEEFLKSFKISKSLLYKLKQAKLVMVDKKRISFSYKMGKTEILEIDFSSLEIDKISSLEGELDILYEDDDLLVVNKPISILVHSDGSNKKTLNNIISYYYDLKGLDLRVRHTQRLDFDTSGIVVYTKDPLSSAYINYQMEKGIFKRYYRCLVQGTIKDDQGIINQGIGKNRHESNRYLVSRTGRDAITKYKVLKRYQDKTLLEVELLTGRRHQIRVHFAYINHPIVGDSYYGEKGERLMLHASRVEFIHPRSRDELIIESNSHF